MPISVFLFILAGLCILPTLISGAISDIKIRKFPKEYWRYTSKIAAIFTVAAYIAMISEGMIGFAFLMFTASAIAATICIFMGYRVGSGGDWRAFMYISLLAPILLPMTAFYSLIIGAVLGVAELLKAKKGDDIFSITIPFALAICVGFAISLLATLWSII